MKKVFVFALFAVASLMVLAQVIAHTQAAPQVSQLISDGGSALTADDVGEVNIWNDGVNLYVQLVVSHTAVVAYDTDGDGIDDVSITGWELAETHVALATTPAGIPNSNGNPKPGRFGKGQSIGNKTEHVLGAGELTALHTFPLATAPIDADGNVIVAAHAEIVVPIWVEDHWEVSVEETGWGEGRDEAGEILNFSGSNWAMYIIYTIQ